ncbi:MAG: isoprenyl transferase [Armatimonadetes bacterium]|nr:isoprenyl transferase [Candidatus Hippobium faecium]
MNIPQHIAIIMDGNGRWAKEKGKIRLFGHANGYKRIYPIIEHCKNIGVKYVSLYAFSSENWSRPNSEVAGLMKLLKVAIKQQIKKMGEEGIRFAVSGRVDELGKTEKEFIDFATETTKNNTDITLNLCFNYGGRNEIVDATKKICEKVKNGEMNIDDITTETFAQNLYHPEIPDPELLIRTAGELRISNYLLWEIAYSEIYVTDIYWPDFTPAELDKAIESYNRRERRFGGLASK